MNVGKDTAKQELSNTVEKTINWYSDKAQKLSSENEMQKICILVIPLPGRAPRKTLICV